MRPGRSIAPALLLLAAGLAGCATPPTPGPGAAAPELPEGLRFEAGEEIDADRSSVTLRWRGALAGPVAEGVAAADASSSAPLVLPGTVPLALTLTLRVGAPAEASVTLTDEYGRARCASSGVLSDALDGRADALACDVAEVAPLAWERPWTVRVAATNSRETRIPFELDVAVRALAGDAREAALPAGLADIVPIEVEADDGVTLGGHVYLPNGEGPFATVLQLSPYWNNHQGDRSEAQAIEVAGRGTIAATSAGPLGELLDSGFAVALVNVRGTGASGGCNAWMDLERDGKDAYAVVEALAAAPWSDGNVGMMGISWHGFTQYAAAGARPPSLKALAPSSAVLDPWLLWTRYGAPLSYGEFATATPWYAVWTLELGGWLPAFGDNSPDHLACPGYAEQAAAFEAIAETGDDAPFWEARRAHDAIAASDVPMLVTNGLRVPGEGHVLQVEGLWPLLPRGSHLMLGPWDHEFPSDAGADRYTRRLVDWFDEHLRGGPSRVAPGVAYQDAEGQWRAAAAWPPPGRPIDLHLGDGVLALDAAESEAPSERTFQSLEGETPRPSDCPFWALYATPPLRENVTLAGNFELEVVVSSTLPDGNFAALLWHAEEVVACGGEETGGLVGRAVTTLRHRGHLRVGEPFPVGGEATMRLRSHPLAVEVPAGHRLVLAIGGDVGAEIRDKAFHPLVTVRTGGERGGALRVPVVEGDLAFA